MGYVLEILMMIQRWRHISPLQNQTDKVKTYNNAPARTPGPNEGPQHVFLWTSEKPCPGLPIILPLYYHIVT